MNDSPSRPQLLDELEERQNEVLHQLDELNVRVEAAIREFSVHGMHGDIQL